MKRQILALAILIISAIAPAHGPPTAQAKPLATLGEGSYQPQQIAIEQNNEIPNPGRGLYRWQAPPYICDPALISNKDKYERWAWSTLESAPGVYDWSKVHEVLNKARTRGQRVWLGIAMSVTSTLTAVPNYMVQDGWGDRSDGVWYPNYNNPQVRQRLELLLDSFVQEFPATSPDHAWIAGVQMRSYGKYGENYIERKTPASSSIWASPATAEWMVDAWHSRLRGLYRLQIALSDQHSNGSDGASINNNQYIFQYAMTKTPRWGWFRDALGHDAQMQNIDRAMESTAVIHGVPVGEAIRERWKYEPVFTEMIGEYLTGKPIAEAQAQFALAKSQVLSYHVSLVGNGNFAPPYKQPPYSSPDNACTRDPSSSWTDENVRDMVQAGKLAGYRYGIDQVRVLGAFVGNQMAIEATWRNHGNAPIYDSVHPTFQLRKNGAVVWQGESAFQLGSILEAATGPVTTTDAFDLPTTLPVGTYALHVQVAAPAPYQVPLNLAIGGKQSDGSYYLGDLAIGNSSVSIAQPFFNVKEWAGEIVVPVRLSQAAAEPVTAYYRTADANAHAGEDYIAVDSSVTFAPGEVEKLVHIAILNDTKTEVQESLYFSLYNADGATIGAVEMAVIYISAKAQFMVGAPAYSARESEGYVDVAIRQIGTMEPGETAVISYTTQDESAQAGSDYQATTGSITFSHTQHSANLRVPLINDSQYEPTEQFQLVLIGNPQVDLDLQTTTTVRIQDDDTSAHFSAARYEVHEGAGSVQLTVDLSQPSEQQLSFGYTAVGGSATAGADFPAGVAGTISFAPGQQTQEISIPINEDAIQEGEEVFTVQLTATGNGSVSPPSEAKVAILPNDAIRFTPARYHGAEGTTLLVAVELNAPSSQLVKVSYDSSSGSAIEDVDFKALKGTISFAPGETRKYIEINLLTDKAIELDEDFPLILFLPHGAQLGSPAQTTITIDGDLACDPTVC